MCTIINFILYVFFYLDAYNNQCRSDEFWDRVHIFDGPLIFIREFLFYGRLKTVDQQERFLKKMVVDEIIGQKPQIIV